MSTDDRALMPAADRAQAMERRAAGGRALDDEEALSLSDLLPAEMPALLEAARAIRDKQYGARVTFSPKVFLPVTNLCRNRCDYCSFRRSPTDDGAWTMSPGEIDTWLERAKAAGCVEALLCLGDKPETAFGAYRRELAGYGHDSTVSYLSWAGERALSLGLLPHTNAGVLTREDMMVLKPVNVSMGLMLETVSARLCEPGMPHHRAPDKRPERRLRMLREAGELRIPFTTGILIGIGETRRERVESLLAIRDAHRAGGHIQEVIVQSFRARPAVVMADAPEPDDDDLAHAVAVARLILDDEVSLQVPPNLSPTSTESLLSAGINDFGGISPVTPDYINPRHAWPHLERLGDACAALGFSLRPRTPIYETYVTRDGFLDPSLLAPTRNAEARLSRVERLSDLAERAPQATTVNTSEANPA